MMEILAAVSAVVLILSVIGLGWSQIFKHGEIYNKYKNLMQRLKNEEKASKESKQPDLTDDQHDRFIDSL
jgi:hypothetical protein